MRNRFLDYKDTFLSIKDKSFRQQLEGDILNLYAGMYEGKYALAISTVEIINVKSTEIITLKWVKIHSKNTLLFVLENKELLSIFISFAMDIEEVIKKDEGVSISNIYNRYMYWVKMFKQNSNKSSEQVLKGIITELYILNKYVIPNYAIEDAITSWIGSENNHKDIVMKDGTWFEVKGISVGKNIIEISSIEQLQAKKDGYLLVIELERTSPKNESGVRLIDVVREIKTKVIQETVYFEFIEKVSSLGIELDSLVNPEHENNQYRYLMIKDNCYLVNDDFPKIKQEMLPKAVNSVSYNLLLSEIEKNKSEIRFESNKKEFE